MLLTFSNTAGSLFWDNSHLKPVVGFELSATCSEPPGAILTSWPLNDSSTAIISGVADGAGRTVVESGVVVTGGGVMAGWVVAGRVVSAEFEQPGRINDIVIINMIIPR
jgi:hypothetical protein